jgi:hypothetical protein
MLFFSLRYDNIKLFQENPRYNELIPLVAQLLVSLTVVKDVRAIQLAGGIKFIINKMQEILNIHVGSAARFNNNN